MAARGEAVRRRIARVATSRAGAYYFLRIANRVDPLLLRARRGWVSLELGVPILLLCHRGAKSGKPRQTPLTYATDGDRLVLIASNAGAAKHPAWYHNLRARPEVDVVARRRSGRYVARVAVGEERERLWQRALRVFPGYDDYQRRAGSREIPVVVLERSP
jgi:deazaflavin-dependent oxidoreductase (nitroreductase family)